MFDWGPAPRRIKLQFHRHQDLYCLLAWGDSAQVALHPTGEVTLTVSSTTRGTLEDAAMKHFWATCNYLSFHYNNRVGQGYRRGTIMWYCSPFVLKLKRYKVETFMGRGKWYLSTSRVDLSMEVFRKHPLAAWSTNENKDVSIVQRSLIVSRTLLFPCRAGVVKEGTKRYGLIFFWKWKESSDFVYIVVFFLFSFFCHYSSIHGFCINVK